MFDIWEQWSYLVSEKTRGPVHSLWTKLLFTAALPSHAFKRPTWSRPFWKTINLKFTACLSSQHLPSLARIKQDNGVLEEYFCQLLLRFDWGNDVRFPIKRHSSSAGKASQGPDGASFSLCLISTCCNDGIALGYCLCLLSVIQVGRIVSFVPVFKCWCLCCAPAGPYVNHGGWQAEALLAAGAW